MTNARRDKIRVARIIARLNIGGPAIHTMLLTEGLDKERFRTELIMGRPDPAEGDMSDIAREKGLCLVYIPELSREIGISDIAAFFKIFKAIRVFKPDIVHTHTAKAGALGRLAAVLAGVPVRIHTFHGHVFDGYFSPLKAGIFLWMERMLGRATDRVITVSESVRDRIVRQLKVVPAEKCVVIPLGFEMDKFLNCERLKGRFRKAIGVGDEELLVGIVGRLVPIKNHRMFLEAAKLLDDSQAGLKVRFAIIGDGEFKSHLEGMAKEMGLTNVIFTGWIKDLADVYTDLDVVALTSLNEGTPVSLIEAMASGRPVIATDVGGVRDLVTDGVNGILVRSGDAAGFAGRLKGLLGDTSKRSAFGAAGRAFVKERFASSRLIKDVEELYTKCIEEKGL